MRIAALAATVLLAALPAAPARATLTQPAGALCNLDLTHLTLTPDLVYEDPEFSGGPVLLTDEDDPTVVHTGTLTCSLVFGSARDHTGPVYASVTSEPSSRVVALQPTTVDTDPIDWAVQISLCTRVDFDGGTLYWNDPPDRNTDGWWSPSPAAKCNPLGEPTDLRAQDPPWSPPLSVAFQALGEANYAYGPAAEPVCATAGVGETVDEYWECEQGLVPLVSFARAAGAGAVVRAVPYAWGCTDVHTGRDVAPGSALATPDPGVSCAGPPSGGWCTWMELSAYLVPAMLGRVTVSETCGADFVTRVLTPVHGRVAEQWSGAMASGAPPFTCTADEDTTGPAEPSYVVTCGMW